MAFVPTSDPRRAARAWAPPGEFEEYVILRALGRGAMGQVFLARDRLLDRQVAIKFVLRFDDPVGRARFLREARAVARLQHPNVVTVHRVGEIDGCPYIVSEFVAGRTLDQVAAPMPWRDVVAVGLDLARGLAAAHKSGVLHRDIKPSNAVLGEDGTTKLLDFGLAKLVGYDAPPALTDGASAPPEVTASPDAAALDPAAGGGADRDRTLTGGSRGGDPDAPGALLGTPFYLAPERWRGEPATEASDLYAVGVVLFELASGVRPHEAPDTGALAALVTEEEAPPLGSLAPEVPPRLAEAIDRCLARDPARRHPSAEALRAALADIPVAAEEAPPPVETPRGRRGRAAFAGLAAAGVAAAAAVGLWAWPRRAADPPGAGLTPAAAVSVTGNRRLTFDPGCEGTPSFTPDGAAILFAGVAGDDVEILRLELADGRRTRLSTLPGWDVGPVASPDGRRIAFVHFGARGRELHVVEAGRTRLLDTITGMPAWLPGGQLLYGDPAGQVVSVDLDRAPPAAPAVLARLPDAMTVIQLRAFADGGVIVQAKVPGPDLSRFRLVAIDPAGAVRLLDAEATASESAGLALDATGAGFYYGVATPAGVDQLTWRARAGGAPVALPGVPVASNGMDVSRDGRRAVLSNCREAVTVARLRPGGELALIEERHDWSDGTMVAIDGRRLLVGSDRSGRTQIWLLETGRPPRPVVDQASDQPAVSPDGSRIAWVGREPERPGVFVRRLDDAGETRRLTEEAGDVQPLFSHDGEIVYFLRVGGEGEPPRIFAVPAAGGAARPVSPPRVAEFAVSPAADRIAYLSLTPERNQIMVGAAGGPYAPLPDLPAGGYTSPWFTRDGRRLLLVRGGTEVVEVPLAGGQPRTVWKNPTAAVMHVEEAPDDDGWLASIILFEGDLVLLDGRFR